MRNVLIILILSLFWSCTSCTENKPLTDADQDSISKPDHTSDEFQDKAPDITPDPDMAVDKDNSVDELPDEDEKIPCLDLKLNENTVKTDFPFTDRSGKSTFCRPGCDTPTETDPQCVRNIWEWENWKQYQEYLNKNSEIPECYPWPCKLSDTKAATDTGLKTVCDRDLTVAGYASMGTVWTHGLSEGIVGMLMSSNAVEYNPIEDVFYKIGKADGMLSFNKNRYVVTLFDSNPNDNPDYKAFVISIERKNGQHYYELIYDNQKHNAFMSNPSFAGEKWVLIQIRPGKESSSTDVKYAKVGEWKWNSLNLGRVQEGNIVDDRLSFIIHDGTADRQIYYCNLSNYPSGINDCTKVTRNLNSGGYEQGHSPRIDEDNKNRLIYYINGAPEPTLVEVTLEEGKNPLYNEIKVDHRFQTEKVKGNILMYTTLDNDMNFMSCWYRFDKHKSYCPKTHDWVSQHMAFATFTEKWQLYKGSISFTLRDWECYCKETGVCPFDE